MPAENNNGIVFSSEWEISKLQYYMVNFFNHLFF